MSLFDAATIISLAQENSNNDYAKFQNKKQLMLILQLWEKMIPTIKKFTVNSKGVFFQQQKECSYFVSFPDFLQYGLGLLEVENDANLSSLIEQFQNPQQFSSTVFEIKCAIFCKKIFNIKNLCFSPAVQVKNKIKKPDFNFIHPDQGGIYCECKSPISFNRTNNLRANKFTKHTIALLKNIGVPVGKRIEIFFEKLPRNHNGKLIKHLIASIEQVINMKVFNQQVDLCDSDTKDKISLIYIDQSKPIHFSDSTAMVGVLFDNDTVQLKTPEMQKILIIEKENKIVSAYKLLLEDALKQLPDNKKSIVFIEAIGRTNNYYSQKMNEIVAISKYNKLLCCILMYGNYNKIEFFYPNADSKKQFQELVGKNESSDKR